MQVGMNTAKRTEPWDGIMFAEKVVGATLRLTAYMTI